MKHLITLACTAVLSMILWSCEESEPQDISSNFDLIQYLGSLPSDGEANGRALPRPLIWGDCDLFGSVVTNAVFDPANGNFDELYSGGNNFLDGVGLISESQPGDQDYNGGRWHMNLLKSDVDPDKYADACSVEDLDPNDFEATENYFECPMLPRKSRG